jgi:hypothetical protein
MDDTESRGAKPVPGDLLGSRFTLFADCLYVATLTAVASLPVVTGFAALAAGCRLLSDRLDADRDVTVGAYLRLLRAALRPAWAVLGIPALAVTVLVLDLTAAAAGLPGAAVVLVTLLLLALAATAVGLRAATSWTPGERWGEVFRRAAREVARRKLNTLGLFGAVLVTLALAWSIPLLAVLAPGLLVVAAVAVARHRPAS